MQDNIWELESMKKDKVKLTFHAEVGKYSCGPICQDHRYIKSIGVFCSFAKGVAVVQNHELRFVTKHPMISNG